MELLGKRQGDHYTGGFGFRFTPESHAEVRFRVHVKDADRAFLYLAKSARQLGGYALSSTAETGQTSGWEEILDTVSEVAKRPEVAAAATVVPYGELIRGAAAGAPDIVKTVQGLAGGKPPSGGIVKMVAKAAQGDPDALACYAEVTRRDGTPEARALAGQAKAAAIALSLASIRAERAKLSEHEASLREQLKPLAPAIAAGLTKVRPRVAPSQEAASVSNVEGYGT